MDHLVSYRHYKGFTLIELMIVIAIVAILATVAIPSYQNYTKKAAVTELVEAAAPYKGEVELCIYNTDDISHCNAGSNGIQKNMNEKGRIQSIQVAGGVITVVGKGTLEGVSYSLIPKGNGVEGVSWTIDCGEHAEIFPANFCSNINGDE